MKSILFLTDYAPHAKIIYRYALELAHRIEGKITLAHVYESATNILLGNQLDMDLSDQLENFSDEQWEDEMAQLIAFSTKNRPDHLRAIDLDYIISTGDVALEVVDIQKKNHFDLIAMGAHTKKGMADVLFGSVAAKILKEAECPVLSVPISIVYTEIKNILYATNFEQDDMDAIKEMMEWAQMLNAELNLLHVSKKENREMAENKMKKWVQYLQNEENAECLNYKVLEGKVAPTILQFSRNEQVDLIAMTTHKRTAWQNWANPSITKEVLNNSTLPLLIFQSPSS